MNEMTSITDALSANYMQADLTVRIWSATKKDHDATKELLTSKHAVSDAASVVTSLLAGADGKLKETKSAYMQVRSWFYANTLSMGSKLYGVPVTEVFEFLKEFAALKKGAEAVREKFVEDYEHSTRRASVALGDLYNAANYPSVDEVRGLFSAELEVRPMPAVTDFDRLAIPGKLAEGLKGLYVKQAQAQADAAVSDMQSRLLAEVDRLVTQLSKVAAGEKTRLYQSLTGNLKQMVGLVRGLGAIDNGKLSALADDIEGKLLAYDVEAYKGNAALARKVAADAVGIRGQLLGEPVGYVTNVVSMPAKPAPQQAAEPDNDGDFDMSIPDVFY